MSYNRCKGGRRMNNFGFKDLLIVCFAGLAISSTYGWIKCNKEWYELASKQNDEWYNNISKLIETLKEVTKKEEEECS